MAFQAASQLLSARQEEAIGLWSWGVGEGAGQRSVIQGVRLELHGIVERARLERVLRTDP